MEAKNVYQSIVTLLFNVIKNEKLRTKILLDLDFRNDNIELVNNLLSLEKDHEASFKDVQWSTVFAKAIVNISKEKVKFEKPDNKSIEDCYGDYSGLLTKISNLYDVEKSTLTDSSIEISEKEIKLNQTVSLEMKEKYSEAIIEDKPEGLEVEVVDNNSEQPNIGGINQNAGAGFGGGFGGSQGFGQGFGDRQVPPPPMADARFYPYTSKLKNIKWYKIGLATTFGVTGLMWIILSLIISLTKYTINTKSGEWASYFNGWATFAAKRPNEDVFNITINQYYGNLVNNTAGYFIIAFMALILSYILYMMIMPARNYREQFRISLFNIIMPFILLLSFFQMYLGNTFATMSNHNEAVKNIRIWFEGTGFLSESDLSAFGADDSIKAIVDALTKAFNVKAVTVILWINLVFISLCFAFMVTILIINPKLDRRKVMHANQEYQQLINEALQGRVYEMDQSIYEPEAEVKKFYDDLAERAQKRNKDNE
ncbi:hypothetical protein SCHIN_v1c06940 [Spiroplasma chinense]|uniref:Transmembrane protein n=1 Tax=Spiroplasma chinense TaxID=216932 RepID=A0A5B9Y4C8_9MOLU|nr:hypothetical protein [Spiroplasma chinense]QEH61891.1 hypothetical protein SCHIN_v1c06940 [Spiroplasma chinense]